MLSFLCEFANSNVAYVVNSDKRGSKNSKLKVKMLAMSTICFIWEEHLWYARVKLRMEKLFMAKLTKCPELKTTAVLHQIRPQTVLSLGYLSSILPQ